MNEAQIKDRVIPCPHCQGMVLIQVRTEIVGLQKYSEADARAFKDLQPDQKVVFDEILASGLLDSFGKTARYAHGDQCPKDLTRFFRTIIGSVVTRKIPRFALEHLRKEISETGQFQFWCSNRVGMVVIDNTLRAFVPTDVVLGQIAKSLAGGRAERSIVAPATPEKLVAWFEDKDSKLRAEQWTSFIRLRKVCA